MAITAIVVAIAIMPSASAAPYLIKCPDNTHIWAESRLECPDDGLTLGGGGGRQCGGLCGILRRIPGLGGLF